MKTLLITALSLITLTAFAQKDTVGLKIPYTDGAVLYEKVFETPGIPKAALLNNSHVWFIQCQKGDDDIQLLDTSLFKIVGKGSEPLSFKGPLNVTVPMVARTTIQIDCKDNKYRCRIYNITLDNADTSAINRFETTPEQLVATLTGNGTGSGLNKNQARRLLESLNATINNTMAAMYKTIGDKNDF